MFTTRPFIKPPAQTFSVYLEKRDLLVFADGRIFEVEKDWPLSPQVPYDFRVTTILPFDYMRAYFENRHLKQVTLKLIDQRIKTTTCQITGLMDQQAKLDQLRDWWRWEGLDEKLLASRRELHRLKTQRKIVSSRYKQKTLAVAQAKQVPCSQFIDFNQMGMAKCPFHPDHNASLHYYPKQNRWWCFGCNEGGDVIDLTQRLFNLSFVEAVKKLT